MSRSVPVVPIPLRFVILASLLALVSVLVSPGPAIAGDESQSNVSDYVQTRVHVLDPPEVTPGDDDQPTIVTRKRARQIQLVSESGGGESGGATPVSEPRPAIWLQWTESFRAFVGRLGMLLRMPS